MVLEKAQNILKKGYICDHCLGRQFGQLLTGWTNQQRGEALRSALALKYETEDMDLDKSNFCGFEFRKRKVKPKKPSKCYLCEGLFRELDKWMGKAEKKLKKLEFDTFLVGTKLSPKLVAKEEKLWEEVGIEYCEPFKAEVNRELGKLLEKKTGKEVDLKNPDIVVILNLKKNRIELDINSLYISSAYKKLVRGIPQTKWDKYPVTVEDIIAEPIMEASKGSGHSLHGAGREDINARCLDWRPFVFEVKEPKKRKLDWKELEKKINKSEKVQVKGLEPTDRKEVVDLKEKRTDKTYRILVEMEKPVDKEELKKLKKLKGTINQRTPERVSHRRADKTRKRKVKSIDWKITGKSGKRLELELRGESGLYVKELVTGDSGRTKPSVSEVLGCGAKVKELDVVKIWG